MTETNATTAPGAPVFPPGRYGRRREPRRHGRLATALVLAAVLAVGLAVAVRLYRQYGDPAYDAEVISYTGVMDTQIIITFRVNLPAGRGAACTLRARSADGAVVGRDERVPVPPDRPEVTYRLPTTARPVVGEVIRCRPAG